MYDISHYLTRQCPKVDSTEIKLSNSAVKGNPQQQAEANEESLLTRLRVVTRVAALSKGT